MTSVDDLFASFCKDQYFDEEPETLYNPVNYILDLPAKRIRPKLCLLSYKLFKEDVEKALPQAFAVELFHNFTLMHDDIMDEAPLRRGQATVHKKFGLSAAILSGDVMLIHCYPYVAQGLEDSRAMAAIAIFTDTAIGICHGQQYDLDFESQEIPSVEAYLHMIHGKTAILLGCAMALGGLAASVDEDTQEKLFQIGVDMGMSFQIQDDFLDIFGSSKKTGKVRGGDILQGKKTLPYLKALEVGGARTTNELTALYQGKALSDEMKVNRVIEIFESLGVDSHVVALRDSYYQRAIESLHKLACREQQKESLELLFRTLLDRDH